MLERFDEDARLVGFWARWEAYRIATAEIESEHFLMATHRQSPHLVRDKT